MNEPRRLCHNLVLVAGHAPFKESVINVPVHPERDDDWVLQPFQRGEPPLYIEHIRRGVELARRDPASLLMFSGGYTRREAGRHWSEAATYAALARHYRWWTQGANDPTRVSDRHGTEDYSRDSFENLLFSLCRFQEMTGRYPDRVTVVSWAFKQPRFDFHRAAIRFPAARFHYEGCNQPLLLEAALAGETVTFGDFKASRYGASAEMTAKRARRNPFARQHPFARCPGLENFFAFINDPANGHREFPGLLPWDRG